MSEFHDDIFEEELTRIKNTTPEDYNGPWTCSPTKEKITGGIKQLKRLADVIDWKGGEALHVIEFLYLFNSEVLICSNTYNNDKLLVLPRAKVVIDLNNSIIDKIESVLNSIGCEDYIFYSLKDACDAIRVLQAISLFKRFSISIKDKDEITIIAQGSNLLGKNSTLKGKEGDFLTNLFNILFHGEHNWQCEKSYNTQAIHYLEQSLLPDYIFCYEDSSYIKKEDGYCIETLTIDNSKFDFDKYDWTTPAQIAIFSKDGVAVKFYGVFKLDKDKSKSNNFLTFEHCSKELNIY